MPTLTQQQKTRRPSLLFGAQHMLMLIMPLLTSCILGPDFKQPVQPAIEHLATPAQVANIAAANGQHLQIGKDIPGKWWELFHSHALNQLLEKALKRNPSLQAALASLTTAQETRLAQASELLPALDATLTAKHQKVAGAQFGNPNFSGSIFTLYNASVSISYTLDLFGNLQRQLESLDAQTDFQRYQLEAAFLTLAGNIVTSAIQEAALRAQITATESIIRTDEQQLALLKQQLAIGSIPKLAVLNQETKLAQTRSGLPTLHKQLAGIRHQLSTLVGEIPGDHSSLSPVNLTDLQLPQQLPLSLASKLVTQRPDIRAQEALLHAASAQIGVAATSMFPDLTISANLSSIATTASQLLMPGTAAWGIGGSLLQPLFHSGQFNHAKRAALAVYQQASADYRSTVLKAFQHVADTLSALEFDHNELQAQNASLAAAEASLSLIKQQQQLGAASQLERLAAERAHQQASLGQIKAQAARFADTAALFQALGGGWWNRPDLAKTITQEQRSSIPQHPIYELPRLRKLP